MDKFIQWQILMLTSLAHIHSSFLDVTCKAHRLPLPFLPGYLSRDIIRIYHGIESRLGRRGHGTSYALKTSDRYQTAQELHENLLWPEAGKAVPDQHHLSAHELMIRAYDVRDALDERLLGGADDVCELRGQALARDRPLPIPGRGVRHAGGHGDAPAAAVAVGHDLVERGRAGGEVGVPDEVDEPAARLDGAVPPGDQVRQRLRPGPVEEGEPLAERRARRRARRPLRHRPPQRAVARVRPPRARAQDPAHRRAGAVGADDDVRPRAPRLAAVGAAAGLPEHAHAVALVPDVRDAVVV